MPADSALKKFLRTIIPQGIRQTLQNARAKSKARRLEQLPPLSLTELESLLTSQLGLRSGDTVFVHSSFSDLKPNASPKDVVDLLVRVVGEQGNILMPFYPLEASHDFLLSGEAFDLRQHWTSMGALSTVFGAYEGTRKSVHPTKSVAVWGHDRDFLIGGHTQSKLPFDRESPYGRMLKLKNAKILGLGVGADFLSSIHVAVDTTDYPVQPYHPEPLLGHVITHKGEAIDVWTFAHNLAVNNHEDIPRFLRETNCPSYKPVMYKGRNFYIVDALAVVNHTIEQAKMNKTFFYPQSLVHQQPKRKA